MTASRPAVRVAAVGAAASLAVPLLFATSIALPHIRHDDINFLTVSRTWSRALSELWQPMNDHAMPLCRLAAAVLMQLVPGQAAIPTAAELQGPLAVIVGMWLVYLFVKREVGQPVFGLAAMILWGVTSTYFEAVNWYAASFFVLSLDTVLLGLLAAQAWRQSHRWHHLLLCAAWCALAPGWYAGGILAGPWCALYLLPVRVDAPVRDAGAAAHPSGSAWRRRAAAVLPAAVPLAGSLSFLAISLPRTAGQIVHASHYGGKTVFEAFDLSAGLENTLRTIADNQLVGAVGIFHANAFSWPWVLVIVGVAAALGVAWWRVAPHRRLLVLGLAIVLASDILTYSARADWNYVRTVHRWTRYHVFPHLGLVLFIAGGLPGVISRRWNSGAEKGISQRQMAVLFGCLAVAFGMHLPRAARSYVYVPEQIEVLRRVERTDTYCRAVGIDGDTARSALGFLSFPLGYSTDNAWDFLVGSRNPRPMTVDDARRILPQ